MTKKKPDADEYALDLKKGAMVAHLDESYNCWEFGYLDALEKVFGNKFAHEVNDKANALADDDRANFSEERIDMIRDQIQERLEEMVERLNSETGATVTVKVAGPFTSTKGDKPHDVGDTDLIELNKRARKRND